MRMKLSAQNQSSHGETLIAHMLKPRGVSFHLLLADQPRLFLPLPPAYQKEFLSELARALNCRPPSTLSLIDFAAGDALLLASVR